MSKSSKKKDPICFKCGHHKSTHMIFNYTDGIALTEGGLLCPTSLYEERNF